MGSVAVVKKFLARSVGVGAVVVLGAHSLGQVENRIARSASLPFLRLSPRAFPLGEGERQWQFGLTNTNEFRVAGGLVEDAETTTLRARYRQSTSLGELSVEVPLHARGGGVFDRLIDWWHHHVLSAFYDRSLVPYGRSEVTLPVTGTFGSAAGLGDVSVGLARPLGTRWFVEAAVKLPTGDASKLLGSGAVDVAAAIHGVIPAGTKWSLFGQAGVVAQGRTGYVRFARGLVDQWALGANWLPNRKDRWTVQWQSESSALMLKIPRNDSPQRQLTFAYERSIGEGQSLQAFFTEDGDLLNFRVPEVANIAPDFSIGIVYRRKF